MGTWGVEGAGDGLVCVGGWVGMKWFRVCEDGWGEDGVDRGGGWGLVGVSGGEGVVMYGRLTFSIGKPEMWSANVFLRMLLQKSAKIFEIDEKPLKINKTLQFPENFKIYTIFFEKTQMAPKASPRFSAKLRETPRSSAKLPRKVFRCFFLSV